MKNEDKADKKDGSGRNNRKKHRELTKDEKMILELQSIFCNDKYHSWRFN